MERSIEEIQALKRYCVGLSMFREAGAELYQFESLRLPLGCKPDTCDALLCPGPHNTGYPSRLFFSQKIECPFARNWNGINVRIGERNWQAYSWTVDPSGLTLEKILIAHLNGLAKS